MKKRISMVMVLALVCGSVWAQQVLSFNDAIQQVVKDIESNVKSGTRVAVLSIGVTAPSIAADKEAFSDHAIGEITTALVQGKKLVVVSRREIDGIRQEMRLQLSGDVSDESAQSIGKMLGAQTVITGSFTKMGNNYQLRVNAVNVTTAQYESSVSVMVNGRDDAVSILIGPGAPLPAPEPAKPTSTAAVPPAAGSAAVVYKVGDRGPAGGFVFYDKGNDAGGWRYLEAAPASAEFTASWDPNSRNVPGTKTETGSGKNNTQLMVGKFATLAYRIAGLNTGGYNDWFLPSKDELHLMYLNLSLRGVGSFKDGEYWTSSGDGDSAGCQNFSNGSQGTSGKSTSYNVRAIRAFSTAQATASVLPPPAPGQYKVGSAGPAGGIVFYDKGNDSDGWRYLEAAPASAEFTASWDPNNTSVPGTTGGIGDGKKNTRLMSDRFVTLAFRVTGLTIGGYNDWFLPNASELHFMYLNLSLRGLGSFKDGYYWTSLEYSSSGAWVQRFSDGLETSGNFDWYEGYKSKSSNVRAIRAFSTAQATAPVVPPPPPGQYKVGDRGPAGGLVFYDKGDNSDGWRYLEAAPASAEFTAQWDPNNTSVSNTQIGLGTGKENTRFMADRLAVLSFRITGLNIGGYSDWFLPSKDELHLMYLNLAMRGLGNFKSDLYWSSSQIDNNNAWVEKFSDGSQGFSSFTYAKTSSWCVRAVRAFLTAQAAVPVNSAAALVNAPEEGRAAAEKKTTAAAPVIQTPAPAATAAFRASHRVATNDKSNLRLRNSPSTSGTQVTSLAYGTQVQVLETGAAFRDSDGNSGNWMRVRTQGGQEGWCFGAYLTKL